MPELPDVEIFRRYVDSTSLHKKIIGSAVNDIHMLERISAQKLQQRLHGSQFRQTYRRGKFLFLQFGESEWLVLHFGMSGFLTYQRQEQDVPDHVRLAIDFDNGYRLSYSCLRRLGRIGYTESVPEYIQNQELGPDCYADGFSFATFTQALGDRSGILKTTLMNQSRMAGLGNIYSDEIMFQAGIHPESDVGNLDESVRKSLYQALKRVIRTAIDRRADPEKFPRGYLTGHREDGTSCPKCDGTITRIKISGRSAYLCKKHQKKY
jgi:formamidopyrimidine-DNA glycosylase